MKVELISLAVAGVMRVSASAYAGLLSKDEIKRTEARISKNYKAEAQSCDSRSGNAKGICVAEAKGNEKVARAELEDRDKGTAKSRQEALVARAEANYDVAKERCDDFAGNAKDVCIKDAQAALTAAKAVNTGAQDNGRQNDC